MRVLNYRCRDRALILILFFTEFYYRRVTSQTDFQAFENNPLTSIG